MIGSINTYSFAQTGGSAATKQADSTGGATEIPRVQGDAGTQSANTQTISTLARQLADSAARAEKRDSTLSRSELADKAKVLLSQIEGDTYFLNKAKHDSEVPKTDDPALLARAKQATAYVNSAASGSSSGKNPFAGLSREQLANITYDDSGTYTVNERRAASYEAAIQEEAWRVKVLAQGTTEYNDTGKLTNFFTSVLDHYKGLPAIEQAQYPKDYASDLESKIQMDFNYRTHRAEGKGGNPTSLIEMLLAQPEGKTVDPKRIPVAPTLKLES
jgi:hypothetical protein